MVETQTVHFLAPWLWLLFPPLAGALIILYLLKIRRREYIVPSVFLWEQALQDLQANSPLQKLRTHLLLLLQLLVLLLAIFALAHPLLRWSRQAGKNIVLILDDSASMQSTDVFPSRFAAAKQEAGKVIEGLGPFDNLMLLAIGGSTRALTPFTHDQRALHAALDHLEVSDTRADLQQALQMVAGLAHEKTQGKNVQVVLISDGAMPAATMPVAMNFPINYVPIGKRSDNVGIVVLDVRWQPQHRYYEGLIVARNYANHPWTCTLEQSLNGNLRDAREITMPAHGQHTEVVEGLPAEGGIFRAALDVHDDLAIDNSAQVVLPRVDAVPVTLVTSGNLFLSTALSLDPSFKVTTVRAMPATLPSGTVLITDNVPLSAVPRGVSALLIGPESLAGEASGQAKTATVVDWDRRHPVLSHVDLTELQLADSAVLSPTATAHTLIETDAGPVALVDESLGRRLISLGWDVRHSDFPLRVSFPIFVSNAINWLSGTREQAQMLNMRTGQILRLPAPTGEEQMTLTDPRGNHSPLEARDGVIVLDGLTRTGIYHLAGRQRDTPIAVNLLDSDESNIAPQQTLALKSSKGGAIAAKPGRVQTEGELWRYLLLGVLAVLLGEWWVYHRRIG
jgi:hypothetical protein